MRTRGFSLIELLIAVAVVSTVLALTVPRFAMVRDRLAAERAARDLVTFYRQARYAAVYRGSMVRLEFGADTLRAAYEGVTDSVFLLRAGPSRHGVSFTASRPIIRIYPNGFGFGAANTKLVVRRGMAAESVTTSRLGRVKKW
jgi:prepilin-type N-terminal cleavage/methylation domain-containing protein